MVYRFGSHMSIAGGYHKAVDAANQASCEVVQIFTTPPRQWPVERDVSATLPSAKPVKRRGQATRAPRAGGSSVITDEDVARFQAALDELQISDPLVHASYLINLASPDDALWKKSIDALVVELRRAERLGIRMLVVHPGAFTTSSEELGIQRVVQALNEAERQTRGDHVVCLLENTSGQGSTLGYRFEHLAEMLSGTQQPNRFAVCIDTCHAFSAGYPLESAAEYRRTTAQLEKTVGRAAVRAIHLNDSATPFGSRKDRHEHIGRGEMGLAPFRRLLNDADFANVPMYLETEKGEENGENWDVINLRVLRSLIKG